MNAHVEPLIATLLHRCFPVSVTPDTPLAQAERAQAWREVRQIEASSDSYRRALQDQVQQAHLRGELA